MGLVIAVLVALLVSLKMIYTYIARVRTTEFHRNMLLDAVADFQYQKLVNGSGEVSSTTFPQPDSIDRNETDIQRADRQGRERQEAAQRTKAAEDLEKQNAGPRLRKMPKSSYRQLSLWLGWESLEPSLLNLPPF